MNVLVIGLGSIGMRHAQILAGLGHNIIAVTRRDDVPHTCYTDVTTALSAHDVDYAVIANTTGRHLDTLVELRRQGFDGKCLVEKPLYPQSPRALEIDIRPDNTYVGYNLRFHPVLQETKRVIADAALLSAQVYVGSYLPDWRPGRDYRQCLSSVDADEGGVLRELSHELDYLLWLTGDWRTCSAAGGHHSSLDIGGDDVFGLLIRTERCPLATVQMNYFDRIGKREIVVNLEDVSVHANLTQHRFTVNDEQRHVRMHADDSYRLMHEAILADDFEHVCGYTQGLATLSLIDAAYRSLRDGVRVDAGQGQA